jgi:hypothetical protein
MSKHIRNRPLKEVLYRDTLDRSIARSLERGIHRTDCDSKFWDNHLRQRGMNHVPNPLPDTPIRTTLQRHSRVDTATPRGQFPFHDEILLSSDLGKHSNVISGGVNVGGVIQLPAILHHSSINTDVAVHHVLNACVLCSIAQGLRMAHSCRGNGKVGESQPASDRFQAIKHGSTRLLTFGSRKAMKERDWLPFNMCFCVDIKCLKM